MLKKDGKPLSDSPKKQMWKSSTASRNKCGKRKTMQKRFEMVLHALRYTKGHRDFRNGRSTIIYELLGDPDFHRTTFRNDL